MRILQINSVCGVGSTGKIAVELYKKYESEGHECVIAYGRGSAPEGIKTIKIGNKLDFYSHVLLSRFDDRQGFHSTSATKKFLKEVEKFKPDLIHLHNIHGYYINIKVLFNYIKKKDIPVKWTLHDCWAFTGHCAHFDYVKCDRWKTSCQRCFQLKSYPKSIFFDNSRKNYYQKMEIFNNVKDLEIVTPSNWLSELVKESFLKKYKVNVVKNTINKDIFKYRESNIRDKYNIKNKFIILGVASPWSKRKGFSDFIKLSKLIDSDTIIIMVGINSNQIKSLPENIIGLERTNNAIELAELYSVADIFFNPTYEDNYPTVNLEAEACGTPVFTYDTGGCKETIFKSESKVVKKGDFSFVNEICQKGVNNENITF